MKTTNDLKSAIEVIKGRIKRLNDEVAQWADKEAKKRVRTLRGYAEVKKQFKQLQYLMS